MADNKTHSRIVTQNGLLTVKNYGVSDLAANIAVKFDTSNTGTLALPIGVILTADDKNAIGFTMQIIPAGGTGQIQRAGRALGIASGTIHVGDILMTDSAGKVLDQTAGFFQIGYAESEAVSGGVVEVWIAPAKNA